MKKISIYLGILMALVVFLSSCKDEDHDENNAVIEISAPLAGSMYNNGDTVFLNATVTAEEAMHGWELYIRKKTDQTQIFTADAHDHAATYTIAEYWVNDVTQDTEMELEIIATIDHDGTTVNKKVDFHCHL